MSGFHPHQSILAGMTPAQLQAALTSAQTAYTELMTGQRLASASYTQGDGSKTVSFSQTNITQLTAFIQLLQRQLGMCVSRRPVRFNFR